MNVFDPLDIGIQTMTYYTGLMIVGAIYASTIFAEFGSKAQGIAWLSVPASALEKLLCALLFSVVLFFVLFTVVFFIVDFPMVQVANGLIARQHRVWPGGYPIAPDRVYNVLVGLPGDTVDNDYHLLLMAFFMLQSVFILGSIYFSRYAFIKTAVAVMTFLLLFTLVQSRVVEPLLPNGWTRQPLLDWT